MPPPDTRRRAPLPQRLGVAAVLALLLGVVTLIPRSGTDGEVEVVPRRSVGLVERGAVRLPARAEVEYESSRLVVARVPGERARDVRREVQRALEASGAEVTTVPSDLLSDGSRVLRWEHDTCGVVDLRPSEAAEWEAVYSRSPDCPDGADGG